MRNAEVHPAQQCTENGDDNLARLTRDFLKKLSDIENEDQIQGESTDGELSPVFEPSDGPKQNEIPLQAK